MSHPIETVATLTIAFALTAVATILTFFQVENTPEKPPLTAEQLQDVQCELWLIKKRASRIEQKLDEKARE